MTVDKLCKYIWYNIGVNLKTIIVKYFSKGNTQRKFYRPQSAIGLVWSTIFQAFGQERVSITLLSR